MYEIKIPGNWYAKPSWWRNFIYEHTSRIPDYTEMSPRERRDLIDKWFDVVGIATVRFNGPEDRNFQVKSLLFETEEDATAFVLKWG